MQLYLLIDILGLLNNDDLLDEINKKFEKIIPISLMYKRTAKNISETTKKIKKFYFNNEKVDSSKKKELINVSK